MEQIYSHVDPQVLGHQVIRLGDITDRHNVRTDDQFLQLATLRMNSGHTFRAHQHIWKSAPVDLIIATLTPADYESRLPYIEENYQRADHSGNKMPICALKM